MTTVAFERETGDVYVPPTTFAAAVAEQSTPVIIGQQYMSWYVLRFPPFPGFPMLNNLVFPGLAGAYKHSSSVRIDSFGALSPDELAAADGTDKIPFAVPAEFKSGRGKPWAVFIVWHKFADTGGISEAGMEGIVKAIAVASIFLLAAVVYRSFTVQYKGAGTGIVAGAKATVFAPGFMIAAVVIAALVFGRRG